ncbi:MAG TPA: hypothetical protein VF773_00840 [Verrucomicrobiae bacterium]
MKVALLCLGIAVLVFMLLFWCMRQMHFRIGSRHLKVILFGLTIRRLELTNVAYASKREAKSVAERWVSTFKTSHRLLVIEKKTGWPKYFCITPQNRYVFLADLKAAVRRVDPGAEWAKLRSFEDTTILSKPPTEELRN